MKIIKRLLALALLCAAVGQAQTLTTVSDTLRNADGTLASGKLRIFWKNSIYY